MSNKDDEPAFYQEICDDRFSEIPLETGYNLQKHNIMKVGTH